MGLTPGSGRSTEIRNGNPLKYPCLGNPMDREAWRAAVTWSQKSRARVSEWTTKKSTQTFLIKVMQINEESPHTSLSDHRQKNLQQ